MQDSIAKEKNGVKKCLEICAIKGGGRRLMAKTILNFHFDYLNPSLSFICYDFTVCGVKQAFQIIRGGSIHSSHYSQSIFGTTLPFPLSTFLQIQNLLGATSCLCQRKCRKKQFICGMTLISIHHRSWKFPVFKTAEIYCDGLLSKRGCVTKLANLLLHKLSPRSPALFTAESLKAIVSDTQTMIQTHF